MSEVIFRLPSKAITYGYVEIKATPEELGDPGLLASPDALGQVYAQFVYAFLKGEQKAVQAALSGTADKYEAEAEADAEELIKSQLGATEVEPKSDAPWDKKVQPKAKPWEQKASAAKAPAKRAIIDFDDF